MTRPDSAHDAQPTSPTEASADAPSDELAALSSYEQAILIDMLGHPTSSYKLAKADNLIELGYIHERTSSSRTFHELTEAGRIIAQELTTGEDSETESVEPIDYQAAYRATAENQDRSLEEIAELKTERAALVDQLTYTRRELDAAYETMRYLLAHVVPERNTP